MATLTKPSAPGWRSVKPKFTKAKARNTSPFTFQSQTYLHAGSKWTFDLELPSMSTAQALTWMTFLRNLCANDDTFALAVTNYVPADVSSPMTVRLVGNEINWDIDCAKRFGISFTVEQVIT